MKGNKGITLIALIVTIIVLIILAGVAIAMLRGDSGILNRASEARYDTILSSVDEQVKLAAVNTKMSITANMVSKPGYIATLEGNFTGLVNDVVKDLSASDSNLTTGFTVKGFLNPSSEGSEGTGYIFITYSDNALRSSLPKNSSSLVVAQSFNGVAYATNPAAGVSPNLAVVTYVIKVTNYSCALSTPVFGTSTGTVKTMRDYTATSPAAYPTATQFETANTLGATLKTKLPTNN